MDAVGSPELIDLLQCIMCISISALPHVCRPGRNLLHAEIMQLHSAAEKFCWSPKQRTEENLRLFNLPLLVVCLIHDLHALASMLCFIITGIYSDAHAMQRRIHA